MIQRNVSPIHFHHFLSISIPLLFLFLSLCCFVNSEKYGGSSDSTTLTPELLRGIDPNDERLAGLDPKLIETICRDILDHSPTVHWDDISGLEFAKDRIQEDVIWPMIRPDLFIGIKEKTRGVLLFGPPVCISSTLCTPFDFSFHT